MRDREKAQAALENAWTIRQHNEVLPVWIIEGKDFAGVIGTPFIGEDSKADAAQAVADLVRLHKATSVTFVSDAWTRSVPEDAGEEEWSKQVSKQLDAVETLTVIFWRRDGTGFTLFRKYRQDDKGRLRRLGEDMYVDTPGDTYIFASVWEALTE